MLNEIDNFRKIKTVLKFSKYLKFYYEALKLYYLNIKLFSQIEIEKQNIAMLEQNVIQQKQRKRRKNNELEKNFQCQICNRSYNTQAAQQKHTKDKH